MIAVFLCTFLSICVLGQKYENKLIKRVDIAFEGADRDISAAEQFRLIVNEEIGKRYSIVKNRNALEKLFDTKKIVSAKIEVTNAEEDGVNLRFVIKRKSIAKKISITVGKAVGEPVTEEQIMLRLNLLSPGTAISDKILGDNADLILTYLRDRGFFKARVDFEKRQLSNEIDVEVIFRVLPNEQALVGKFDFDIENFDKTRVKSNLTLKKGSLYSIEKLNKDVEKVRAELSSQEYLAPRLNEPRIVYDGDTNEISIEVSGELGALIKVEVEEDTIKISDKQRKNLLPILREGTLDFAAIVEGERRLETYYQEKGYFFSRVTPICSVDPKFKENEASEIENDTEILCSALSGADVSNRKINVRYEVNLIRKLRLEELRVEGTDKLAIADIQAVLESQEANNLGFIPFLGYGRGYTSLELLRKDRATLKSILRELGYRNADVAVKQGVSTDGESLIITFVIKEGIPTKINDVLIEGNQNFSIPTLKTELPNLVGKNFSQARARNGIRKLAQFYADKGYYDAKVSYSTIELASAENALTDELTLVYKIENEGKRVFVNRILLNGNGTTKDSAILKAINLKSDTILRLTDIFASEQNLYSTDAFDLVEIREEPAGETPDGKNRQTDILINLDEKPPRLITYGGGYSTDVGASGFFDFRHFNLFGRLQQGGAQVRFSQRQQLFQLDFLNPRFISDGKDEDGKKRFAPLTLTAQYQRDSTVTRFFRSTFDQGTFGIVQRIDENGNPIDEFGNNTGDPTINRFSISAETNRTISKKNRSLLFVRYRFEDVRLFNFESLLIEELLRPDDRIRISGFGTTFVIDTRENCSVKNTLLELIAKGEPGDPCRYNPGEPTKGDYLTAEFNVSLPFLGANIGFNKFQLTYNKYFTIKQLGDTVFAGRAVLGLANVFSSSNRFGGTDFPQLEGILPISERFFAGGSTTIRGFQFEAAGPRVAILPQGTFRTQNGEIINLSPFTVPFGGNGLAITNLEARVPITESISVVPFYDGGNVFQRVGEIFNPANAPANDVFRNNARAVWSHTVGLGFRLKTPIGGEFAIDYGYLLNPPNFLIPQQSIPNTTFRLHQGEFHFRFSQAF